MLDGGLDELINNTARGPCLCLQIVCTVESLSCDPTRLALSNVPDKLTEYQMENIYVEDLIDVLGRSLIVDGRGGVSAQHVENSHSPEEAKKRTLKEEAAKKDKQTNIFLHAGHFGFGDESVAVEIVEAENPSQFLLDGTARRLRQRLQEILCVHTKESNRKTFYKRRNCGRQISPARSFCGDVLL